MEERSFPVITKSSNERDAKSALIVFFVDRAILPGLHATLASLVEVLAKRDDESQCELRVFATGLTAEDVRDIQATVQVHSRTIAVSVVDYRSEVLAGAHALLGGTQNLGKLRLPELLPEANRVIFLDADLVVCRDPVPLLDMLNDDVGVVADGGHVADQTTDRAVYRAAGLRPTADTFNSGVLAINLDYWRRQSSTAMLGEVAARFEGQFVGSDQPLLNIVFANAFRPVGESYNSPLYFNNRRLKGFSERIYHFVGSPKPWDLFVGRLHSNYAAWRQYYDRSAIGSKRLSQFASLKRSLRIWPKGLVKLCRRYMRNVSTSFGPSRER